MPNLCLPGKNSVFSLTNRYGQEKVDLGLRILKGRDHRLIPAHLHHLPQNQTTSNERRFFTFGGISEVSYINSSWNPVKLSLPYATSSNWSNWTVFCLKKGQFIRKDMVRWFFSLRQCTIAFVSFGLELLEISQLGGATLPRVFTGSCFFQLPYIFVVGSRTDGTAFLFL